MGCAATKRIDDISNAKKLPFPLSYYQKCILKDTWYAVEANKLEFGTQVFIRLLDKNPGLIQVFPEFQKMESLDEMLDWHELQGHPRKIVNALGKAIRALDDGDLFISQLEELGARHQTRNLEPEYLTAVGESIMAILPTVIPKEDWNNDANRAWKDLYNFVCKTMKIGLNKATGDNTLDSTVPVL